MASHNKGKVWEINTLLKPYGIEAVSAGTLGLPEPDETETTFVGNARIKALSAARGSGLMSLADDSGLEVDCLGGAPSVFSADWAGPSRDFGLAMKKTADEITKRQGWSAPTLQGPGPLANFISVLCLASPDGHTREFEGKVYGHLVWPPRGGNGFGYDAMFVPTGETLTFGEMEPAAKYAISHRTRAFEKFKVEYLEHTVPSLSVATTGPDWDGYAAAAASLSTQAEFVNFALKLAQENADGDAVRVSVYLANVANTSQTVIESDEPKWRTFAKVLLVASRVK